MDLWVAGLRGLYLFGLLPPATDSFLSVFSFPPFFPFPSSLSLKFNGPIKTLWSLRIPPLQFSTNILEWLTLETGPMKRKAK